MGRFQGEDGTIELQRKCYRSVNAENRGNLDKIYEIAAVVTKMATGFAVKPR